MRILLITHDFKEVEHCVRDFDCDTTLRLCLKKDSFKKIVRDFKPDVILSNGICKDEKGEMCVFLVRKELKKLKMNIPVYPIFSEKTWRPFLRMIKRSKATL